MVVALAASSARGQRDLRDIPPPDPELERATFQLADGFEVNLFAADPQIAKPIQMNFDAAGRLWIASSEVYPQILPGQPAADRILVLEDTNGDGTADRTTVFADGLLIPTGVEPGDGGAYVANSTELVHLADTTGDGRADRRRIVLSGFGTEDTHHLLHTLRWGPDGRLYMSQSIYIHSHVETPLGPRRLMGGGVWQFRPEVQQLEVFCRGLVNPWGTHFDRYGQCFLTDGAGGEGINYAFPGAMFPTAVGAARVLHGLNPGSPKYCGLEVVGGSHLPDDWQGNLITCDFRAHRVCRFVVSDDGSGFAAREQPELIRSMHVAFRPVDVKLGPDGAIYLADWYNPIIQHGEVDFRDPRRDKVHGRIWRITAKGRPLAERVNLTVKSVPELVEHLGSPEPWVRHFARLQLKQRYHGDRRDSAPRDEPAHAIRTALVQRYRSLPPLPQHDADRLEVIWTLQALSPEVSRPLLAPLLRSADFRIRAAATRIAAESDRSADGWFELLAARAADPHPRVRLEAINALRQRGTAEAVQAALTALEFPLDTNLDFAMWLTARECKHNWLPLVEQQATDLGGPRQLAFALLALDSPEAVVPLVKLLQSGSLPEDRQQAVLNAIARHGQGEHLGLVFDLIVADDSAAPARRAALLESLVAATAARRVVPGGDLTRLAALFESSHPQLVAAAVRAAGAWKLEALRQQLADLAADAALPLPLRQAAIDGLASLGGSARSKRSHNLPRPANPSRCAPPPSQHWYRWRRAAPRRPPSLCSLATMELTSKHFCRRLWSIVRVPPR
jgi:glucose/arabinose dehydrogenase/HEAT repeat protein